MQDETTVGEECMDAAVLHRLCKAGPLTIVELRRELGLVGHNAADRLGARPALVTEQMGPCSVLALCGASSAE